MNAERCEHPDDLDLAVDAAAIDACDGDPRATIRALIVANSFLTEQVDTLTKELDRGVALDQPGLHALNKSAANENQRS